MDYTKVSIDNSFKIKSDEAVKEQQLIAKGKTVAIPMQSFYSTDYVSSMINHCEDASQIIKKTVSELEKSKMLQ